MGTLYTMIRSTPMLPVSQKRLVALLRLKEKIAELMSLEQKIENQIASEINSGASVETGKLTARIVNNDLVIY